MKKLFVLSTLSFALLLEPQFVQAQQLTVQTSSAKSVVLTRADIEALPHVTVATGNPPDQSSFVGVSLSAVLEKAGVSLGESLRGKRLASYLLVGAADQYRVVFALPELDPAFSDKQFILAFQRNGKPLDEKEGPYRIVIPDEKRMARWVRQVTILKIADVQ
jgi:hypothetical protein